MPQVTLAGDDVEYRRGEAIRDVLSLVEVEVNVEVLIALRIGRLLVNLAADAPLFQPAVRDCELVDTRLEGVVIELVTVAGGLCEVELLRVRAHSTGVAARVHGGARRQGLGRWQSRQGLAQLGHV